MRTRIEVKPHSITPGAHVVELWYGDRFVGTVVGRPDGPGVRILSKYLTIMGDAIYLDLVEPLTLECRFDLAEHSDELP